MRYISTRGQAAPRGFEGVLLAGLAEDGGLFMPETWPTLSPDEWRALRGLPYAELATRLLLPFMGEAVAEADLRRMCRESYGSFSHAAVVPLVQLDERSFALELFHGPTLAFKDVALQLLGRLFDHVLARRGERITIVGATSGDTGGAAIEAFKSSQHASVFMMHPHGRVSDVQRRQMTTVESPSVHNIAIEGNFDDCQAIVKALFNDLAFRDQVGLAGVNSINWARIMAQTVYYVTAALSLGAPGRAASFCVPTGNFGDVFAGFVAKRMGIPVDRLLIATNVNDILDRTLKTGRYEQRGVKASTSPSMDIQISSNFERLLFEVHGRDPNAVRRMMASLAQSGSFTIGARELEQIRHEFDSGATDEAETAATIRQTLADTGELLDPHTAVGYAVARKAEASSSPMVTLATAHPAKVPDAVEKACGVRPGLPPRLDYLLSAKERFTVLPNDVGRVRDFILSQQQA